MHFNKLYIITTINITIRKTIVDILNTDRVDLVQYLN